MQFHRYLDHGGSLSGVRRPKEGWLRRQTISTRPVYLMAQSISHWLIEYILSLTYWPSPVPSR